MKQVDSRRGILDENSVMVLHRLLVPVVNRYVVSGVRVRGRVFGMALHVLPKGLNGSMNLFSNFGGIV